jgi:hypothetical protein
MTRETTNRSNIKLSTEIIRLDEAIIDFDRILEQIQAFMPEDLRVYEAIVQVRDYMFRLQQMMHGCEIVDFCSGGTA